MSKKTSPSAAPERPDDSNRLPVRWAVILGLAATIGFVVYAAAGLAAAVTSAVLVVGVLHAALD